MGDRAETFLTYLQQSHHSRDTKPPQALKNSFWVIMDYPPHQLTSKTKWQNFSTNFQ